MGLRSLRLALCTVVAVCASGAEEALTNGDIVRLTQAGFGPAVLVAKIESSETAFDTSVDALLALAEDGVPEEVVAAMVQAAMTRPRPAPPATAGARNREAVPAAEPQAVRPRAIPGSTFRESLRAGGEGPEMVVIPAGRFRMGCLSNDSRCQPVEMPVHQVTIGAPFALSVHEVTFEDYDRFTYPNEVDDRGWGRGRRPVINVSWNDAQDYVAWLSSQTGAEYRLPSEAEWEYAARAGTTTQYSWGNEIGVNRANCYDCGSQWDDRQTAPAGSFRPNGFGLYDMHGNVYEWVEDCVNVRYQGAPSDGSAWLQGNCSVRVYRGGAWGVLPRILRAACRYGLSTDYRYFNVGFRVARTVTP